MQIDIGFGDVIVPARTRVDYPTLLEKLEALTKLGLLNSPLKDY